MFGRVRGAMADAAETLRRTFAGLPVVTVVPEPFHPGSHRGDLLAVDPRPGLDLLAATGRGARLFREGVPSLALPAFEAKLQAEAGWASWGAEAEVVRMTPLEAGRAAQVAVPPLPRQARTLGRVEPPTCPGTRRIAEPLARPGTRRLDPRLGAVSALAGLEAILGLPIPIRAEDIQRLPKGLWMRYSLQLVRGTGENVRNLEVLGLFRIPRKGVADLRHDPRQSRILIRLEASAVRAPREPFILARRKDDGALLSCFVEGS